MRAGPGCTTRATEKVSNTSGSARCGNNAISATNRDRACVEHRVRGLTPAQEPPLYSRDDDAHREPEHGHYDDAGHEPVGLHHVAGQDEEGADSMIERRSSRRRRARATRPRSRCESRPAFPAARPARAPCHTMRQSGTLKLCAMRIKLRGTESTPLKVAMTVRKNTLSAIVATF